jgi:diguanylate cyclase
VSQFANLYLKVRDVMDTLFGGKGSDLSRAVKNDILMTEYGQLRQQIPALYLTVAITSLAAATAAQGDFPLIFKVIAPALIMIACSVRLAIWLRRGHRSFTIQEAKRNLKGTNLTAIGLTSLSSAWSVLSFYETALSQRAFVPIFGLLTTFAAVYCLSSFRKAALSALLFGVTPMTIVMLMSNDHMFVAMGTCALVVTLLQMRLIADRYKQMVANLELHHKMRILANTDMLTGLPNRRAFLAQLDIEMVNGELGHPFAVALLDLDGFKQVNDRLGHLAGDALLQTVADRLRRFCDEETVIGRIGGDEFAILFQCADSSELISARSTGIIASLAQPCTISGRRVAVTASLGIAGFPSHGQNISELLSAADKALYRAKAAGRDQIQTFDDKRKLRIASASIAA